MYNLKIDNHTYVIPALGHYNNIIHTHEVTHDLRRPKLPVRELSSDIQDLLDYLACPPVQPLKGKKSKRVLIGAKWAAVNTDEDYKKRMKIYEYLEANGHSTTVKDRRFVSYEAAIVMKHYGKILSAFLNF